MKIYYLFDYHVIKVNREKQGLTQKECARLCQVSYQQWQKWENGTNQPTADTLVRIAQAIGIGVQGLHMFYARMEVDDLDERQLEL